MTAELGIAHLAAATAELSVVVPILRERPGIAALHAQLRQALAPLGRRCEVIYVVDAGGHDLRVRMPPATRFGSGAPVGVRHTGGAWDHRCL